MKISNFLLATIALSTLLGCSTHYWKKTGLSLEDAKTVEAKCSYDVGMKKFSSESEKLELIKKCMMAQGFRMGSY